MIPVTVVAVSVGCRCQNRKIGNNQLKPSNAQAATPDYRGQNRADRVGNYLSLTPKKGVAIATGHLPSLGEESGEQVKNAGAGPRIPCVDIYRPAKVRLTVRRSPPFRALPWPGPPLRASQHS
jgi:hypothetical protein